MIDKKQFFFFTTLILLLVTLSCGKRKPPQPPVERVPQHTEQLTGYQQGNTINLIWPSPKRNAPDTSVQSIRRMDVYRLAESPNAPLPLTESEFSARSVLIGSVTSTEIKQFKDNIIYTDAIEQIKQPVRFRYAVRYVNNTGSSAPFSNFLLIEPTSNVSQPPALTGKEESENNILIKWTEPSQNIDGSSPVNLLGFNIYRYTSKDTQTRFANIVPINSSPINANEYSDTSFKYGENYNYFIRAVSLGNDGNPVESLNSNTISINPVDTFAPATPAPVSLATSPGKITIFFPSNQEKDIAGYLIFRSTDEKLPLTDWTKITPEIITNTTFQDSNVETGKRYFYYVIAVDTSGNTSKPSEIVSEIVQ